MSEIVWTETARADLQGIYDFIARDSPALADRTIARVIHAAEAVAALPHSGRVVPELADPDVREVLVGSYWLVYRVWPSRVTIVTVLHGARDRRPDLLEPGWA